MPIRHIRISVAGKFQFTVTVSQDEPIEEVAARASSVMKLSGYRPVISIGQINFVPS